MTESEIDEFHRRQVALDIAARTHEHTIDEKQIVHAAQAYLAFLKGDETSQAPGEVMHHPI